MAKKKQIPKLEDLITDEGQRKQIKEGLLSGKPLSGEGGVFTELLQSIVNACLDGEMDVHMDAEKSSEQTNRRNGRGQKKVKTEHGDLDLSPPRDRKGTFDPKIVEKRSRTLGGGFDKIILALYAQGNSTQDIQRLLKQMYGIDYSTSGISTITEQVWPRIQEWRQRPLKGCYPIIYLDGMHFRVKDDGQFRDKMVYSVLGVDVDGQRDVLGIYLDDAERSSHWVMVLDDIKSRGVEDLMFVCIDGLRGFKDAIQSVYPMAIIQRCIVHKVRNSVRYVSDKERKKVCADLRLVYTSANREAAQTALEELVVKWPKHGPRIAELWRKDWDDLMVFMDFSSHIRRMIYTTNPVEALHRVIRKILKSKGAWINERALIKQLFLALEQNEQSWKRKAFHWLAIQHELEEKFGERFTKWLDK
ncbi:MAG: IS256 family transposase [Bacteroidia bacterium]|nr:IS256 family transposase [Bacteroidia bacterium]